MLFPFIADEGDALCRFQCTLLIELLSACFPGLPGNLSVSWFNTQDNNWHAKIQFQSPVLGGKILVIDTLLPKLYDED